MNPPNPVTAAIPSYEDDPQSDWLIELNDIPDVSPLHPHVTNTSHTAPVLPSEVVTAPSQVHFTVEPIIQASLRSALARMRPPPVQSDISIPSLIHEARVSSSFLTPPNRVHFGATDIRLYCPSLPTPGPLRSILVGEGLVVQPEQSEYPMTPISKVPLMPVPNPMGIPPFRLEEEVKLAPLFSGTW